MYYENEERDMVPKLLDTVALLSDIAEEGLVRGQVGTVVEQLGSDIVEVEFSDDNGQTYAMLALPGERLLVLHHGAVAAA
jgi:hypothetical protein